MSEWIEQCQEDIASLTKEAKLNHHEIDQIKSRHLGKNSPLTKAYQGLGQLTPEERKAKGKELNITREKMNELVQQAYLDSDRLRIREQLAKTVDVTSPLRMRKKGSIHPLTIAYQELETIFRSLGFEIKSGPQVEDDYHNFTALNFPDDHPARAMHDTFYLKSGDRLLRTHTSTVQIHVLENQSPPLRVATPGCVYRCDHDPTHSPMFNQVECLVVEPGCNFAQLKWLLVKVCEAYLGRELEYRFRPSFFPFTEPSAELDIVWGDQWLELGGCGMVHPNVLSGVGIDHKEFPGFAFGLGIDRLAMLKYGIRDLRVLYENHLHFIEQF